MLELIGLSIARGGREIVRDLDFKFEAGRITGLVGANGSGKSTLLAALAGDLAFSGEIKYLGRAYRDLEFGEFRKMRAVLLQELEINFPISVREYLTMAKSDISSEQMEAVLHEVGALELADQKITELSKGQLQRVEIAAVIAQDASVLLLDEPFSAQDAASIKRLSKLFKDLAKAGKSVIIASHIEGASGKLFARTLAL